VHAADEGAHAATDHAHAYLLFHAEKDFYSGEFEKNLLDFYERAGFLKNL
jgi:hypothetical protein